MKSITPTVINPNAAVALLRHPFFSSENYHAANPPQNTPAARHSPLTSQPEGICRIAAKGISLPVSMRKPAQSIRLP